jgi:superfamily II DNA/RNA helicase
MERNYLDLVNFKSVVLDEADRMLDMGFIDDMRFMLAHMPDDRQTLFFSATFSKEIEALTSQFSKNPVRVSVKTRETASNVDQDIVHINGSRTKLDVLHDLLSQEEFRKVLVFGRTKRGVDRLSRDLAKRGFKIEPIHGDKSQNRRERALRRFKENQVQVLIATDVAARGLDISDITHVINYDIPTTYEDYIHRIGRTGRGDQTGKALTFIE